MADGFFLGGFAEGMNRADRMRQRERGLSLQEKALGLKQRQAEQSARQELVGRTQEAINSTMKIVGETISKGLEAGRSPQQIAGAVQPLLKDVQELSTGIGQDPSRYIAAANAALTGPTPAESARTEAQAKMAGAQEMVGDLTPEQKAKLAGVETTAQRAQSSIGKLIADRKMVAEQFGEDSEQVAAIDDAISAETSGAELPDLTDIRGVRQEYTKLSGEFIDAQGSFARVISSPDTAAGDVALVFNFMKTLDPQSVVREGEFALAASAAGLPERIIQLAARVDRGERLTPEQRDDFRNVAAAAFSEQLQEQRLRERTFRELARRQGMNPENVVIPFVREKFADMDQPEPATESTPAIPKISSQQEYDDLPSGSPFIWVEDGKETRARKP